MTATRSVDGTEITHDIFAPACASVISADRAVVRKTRRGRYSVSGRA